MQENKRQKSHCLENLAINISDLKMNLIKWQLNFGSCARSCDFEITRMISDQIALHSSTIINKRLKWQGNRQQRDSLGTPEGQPPIGLPPGAMRILTANKKECCKQLSTVAILGFQVGLYHVVPLSFQQQLDLSTSCISG